MKHSRQFEKTNIYLKELIPMMTLGLGQVKQNNADKITLWELYKNILYASLINDK